ncbi:MAG: hypothetical protein A2352_03095 [Caulobacterales bacterium RIFOXYB1_FULL_67_16]|nr:MAG: hypothetical protein A2352_03095 [Caulobacterales bacterium RIFOXYB1_FULL_67_16]
MSGVVRQGYNIHSVEPVVSIGVGTSVMAIDDKTVITIKFGHERPKPLGAIKLRADFPRLTLWWLAGADHNRRYNA